MKRTTPVAILAALIFLAAAIHAADPEVVKTAVKESQGRSGPGSFYELVVIIPQGTELEVIEKQKSWYKVTYQKQAVWVSVNSLAIESDSNSETNDDKAADVPDIEDAAAYDPFQSLSSFDAVTVKASPATLTAAIKGFWTRYSRNQSGELYELPVTGFDIDIKAFETFADEHARQVSRDRLMDEYPLSRTRPGQDLEYEREHSIGYAIASSIADAPLVTDKNLIDYIHSVGWYVAQGTERYDIDYIYYILDTDRINAVSCPGGYIVVTRGLLELLSDESELAALLAHEMAHIIAGHAMQTLEDESVPRTAGSAFDRLGRETGTSAAEADLIGIANRAVSIATAPKLDEQEFEADRMALCYLARSGYDLGGLVRMLETMRTRHEAAIDIFDLNYRNHPDFAERLRRIEQERRNYRGYNGRTFAVDFVQAMNH